MPDPIPNGNGNGSLTTIAARWLFGQQANTVGVFLIVGALMYGIYAAAQGIPPLLKAGREIHNEIKDEHRAERREAWERVGKMTDALRENGQRMESMKVSVDSLVTEIRRERHNGKGG